MHLVRPFELPVPTTLSIDHDARRIHWTVNLELAIYGVTIVPTSASTSTSLASFIPTSTLHNASSTPVPPDSSFEDPTITHSLLVHHIRSSGVKVDKPVVSSVLEFRMWNEEEAREWKRRILEAADLVAPKRLLVVMNPVSGIDRESPEKVQAGKGGEEVYRSLVAPILEMNGHSAELLGWLALFEESADKDKCVVSEKPLKTMGLIRLMENLPTFDAILVCGGDGMVHEVINGILSRQDWKIVAKIPITIIPSGNQNRLAKSLKITHPLIAILSFLHSKTPSLRTILGVTTMSGLRVFSHSQVQWVPPRHPPSKSWSSYLFGPSSKVVIPTTFGLHHLPPPPSAFEEAHLDSLKDFETECGAIVRRNQPGPPLKHPCLAPSSLPKGWRSIPFDSPLTVSCPSISTSASLESSKISHRGYEPYCTAEITPFPAIPSFFFSSQPSQTASPAFPAEALLITLAPPVKEGCPALPSPRYGMNLRCLPGGKMLVDGEAMEAGPFAVEAVSGIIKVVAAAPDLCDELDHQVVLRQKVADAKHRAELRRKAINDGVVSGQLLRELDRDTDDDEEDEEDDDSDEEGEGGYKSREVGPGVGGGSLLPSFLASLIPAFLAGPKAALYSPLSRDLSSSAVSKKRSLAKTDSSSWGGLLGYPAESPRRNGKSKGRALSKQVDSTGNAIKAIGYGVLVGFGGMIVAKGLGMGPFAHSGAGGGEWLGTSVLSMVWNYLNGGVSTGR
ncbi:Sphingosine kinase 2 [Phlyctochytrium planicorne]|nr:Sphingosine kinase 2 [Phlyctochytrium planicorne]